MKLRVLSALLVMSALALALVGWPIDSFAGPPENATVQFGQEVVNCGKPPGEPCYHGDHRMVPGTVVISAGGTVHFDLAPFHRIAIYEPGKGPKDIDLSQTADLVSPISIPDFVIDDEDKRLAVSWLDPGLLFPSETTFEYTFDTPGRYLVICTTLPHFANDNMYGWVIVK